MKKQRAGMETSRTPDSILTLDLDVFFPPPSLRPHPLVELFCTVASCAVPRRRGRRKWVTELIGGYFVLCERRVCLPPHGWSLLFLPVHDGGDHGQERLKRLRTGWITNLEGAQGVLCDWLLSVIISNALREGQRVPLVTLCIS